ncbi:integral membrane protein DUF92-domain-containing protein [Ochromonadaceae sp. CCMP2298]|nr:integral membrane protein DUF92-domain-containing protein [Ochromonadaceae sp. CCMP2298]
MSDFSLAVRNSLAVLIALGLAISGKRKKSLSTSGAISAIFVGYVAFACSYRFGAILILFYYSSSKLTKFKQDYKAKIEEDYAVGGQRNWMQVLASSLLATVVAIAFYLLCGEDQGMSFAAPSEHDIWVEVAGLSLQQSTLASYLWTAYIAHYCTANADTWASELGVLSANNPRLVTTLFWREVPRGTNGGMSGVGTLASAAGGLFIGCVFFAGAALVPSSSAQYPVLVYSLLCGLLGSLVDSLLGASVQATYYCTERKCIVKRDGTGQGTQGSIVRICGSDVLSNEAVNLLSIMLTMLLSLYLAPITFCMVDSTQCFEAQRLHSLFAGLFR